jgi:hypothetical protein
MARGYPDFFGASTFPGYGLLRRDVYGPAPLLAGITATLHNISSKGNLWNALLEVIGDDSIEGCTLQLYADGEIIYETDPVAEALRFPAEHNQIVRALYIDTVELLAYFSFRQEILWGSSFEAKLTAPALSNLAVYSNLLYYLVST